MPNSRKFSDIVDEQAIESQINFVKTKLKEMYGVITSAPKVAIDYKDFEGGIGESKQKLSELTDTMKLQQKTIDELQEAIKKLTKLKDDSKKKTEEEIIKEQLQSSERKKQIKDHLKDTMGLTNEYDKLSKKYAEASKEAKRLGALNGENSKEFKEAAKEASILGDRLKSIDAAVGQYGRNVGDYKNKIVEAGIAMKGLSPVAGEVVGKVEEVGAVLAKIGPVGGVILGGIAAGVLALGAPLMAFFKGTQEGMDRLEIRMAGFEGAMSVVKGELAGIGKSIDDAFGGDKPDEVGHFWLSLLIGIPGLQDMGAKMDYVAYKAREIASEKIKLEEEEIGLITERANANEGLINARLQAADENRTIAEKIDLYKKAFEEEQKVSDLEIESNEVNIKIKEQNVAMGKLTGTGMRAAEKEYQEAIAKRKELEGESERRRIRGAKQTASLEKELRDEANSYAIALEKEREQKINETNKRILSNAKSSLDQKIAAEKSNLLESLKMLEIERQAKMNQPGMDDTKKALINTESKTAKEKATADSQDRVTKLTEDYNKQLIDWDIALNKVLYDNEIAKNNRIIAADKLLFEKHKEDYDREKEAINGNEKLAIDQENNEYDDKRKLSTGKQKELEILEQQHTGKLLAIHSAYGVQRLENDRALYQNELTLTSREGGVDQTDILRGYGDKLRGLISNLKNGTISLDQFKKAKEELDLQMSNNSIDSQIESLRKLKKIADDEKDPASVEKFDRQIVDLQNQKAEKIISSEEKIFTKKKELQAKEVELFKKSIDLAFQFQDAKLAKASKANQRNLSIIESEKTADVDRINTSTLNEQQKAVEIQRVDSQTQTQKEEIDRKQRKIDREKAKLDKEHAVMSILLNTGMGITAALTSIPPNVPLSIVVGAIGAVELAMATKAAIPAYEKGRGRGIGEWALTDERGPELYVGSNGMYMGGDRPAIRYLSPDTEVIPNDKIQSYLMSVNLLGGAKPKGSDTDFKQLIQWQTAEIKKAVKPRTRVINNIYLNNSFQNHIDNQVIR